MLKTKPTTFNNLLEATANKYAKKVVAAVATVNKQLEKDVRTLYSRYGLPRDIEELSSVKRKQLDADIDRISTDYGDALNKVFSEGIEELREGAVKVFVLTTLYKFYVINQEEGLSMKFLKSLEVEV